MYVYVKCFISKLSYIFKTVFQILINIQINKDFNIEHFAINAIYCSFQFIFQKQYYNDCTSQIRI